MRDTIVIATHGQVTSTVVNLIKECKPHGEVVLLVDEYQRDLGVQTIKVPDAGYDIGKFWHYLLTNSKKNFDSLTFINCTISPLADFSPMFEEAKKYEFFGATDAYTHHESLEEMNGRHIQSFFHSYRGRAIDILKKHYRKNGRPETKEDTIIKYELAISRVMRMAGVSMGVFIKADDVMERFGLCRWDCPALYSTGKFIPQQGGDFIGTFHFPLQYLEMGLPFIKNNTFKYDVVRPYDLLVWLFNKGLEINKEFVRSILKIIFERSGIKNECKGFIEDISTLIYKEKKNTP